MARLMARWHRDAHRPWGVGRKSVDRLAQRLADTGWRYPYALVSGHGGDKAKRERRDSQVSDKRRSSDRPTMGCMGRYEAMAHEAHTRRAELRKLERGGDPLSSPRGNTCGLSDHTFRIGRANLVGKRLPCGA